MAMRIRQKDIELAKKTAKRFNDKIRYHEKKGLSVPERVNWKDFLASGDRKDFNREIASKQRFLERGAEKQVQLAQGKVTSWEIQEYKRNERAINQRRAYQRRVANIDLNNPYTQSNAKNNGLLPTRSNPLSKRGRYEFEPKFKSLQSQRKTSYYQDKKEIYKHNYLKTVNEIMGTQSELYILLKDIPASKLFDGLTTNDPLLGIQFISDKMMADSLKEEALIAWKQYLGMNTDDVLYHEE